MSQSAVEIGIKFDRVPWQPQSGERMQPTAQAVGGCAPMMKKPRKGERSHTKLTNYAHPRSALELRRVLFAGMEKNCLYYGDNLAVLREHIKDESVDLIYLDPPFNSRQDYNVLFAERDGTRSAAQIMAFEDTWEWNMDAERAYEEIVERGGRVSDAMRAFRTFLGHSDVMAYLAD
jgi:hypothetical protein